MLRPEFADTFLQIKIGRPIGRDDPQIRQNRLALRFGNVHQLRILHPRDDVADRQTHGGAYGSDGLHQPRCQRHQTDKIAKKEAVVPDEREPLPQKAGISRRSRLVRSVNSRDERQRIVFEAGEQGKDQRFLGAEMIIEIALVDFHIAGDFGRCHTVRATFVEETECNI